MAKQPKPRGHVAGGCLGFFGGGLLAEKLIGNDWPTLFAMLSYHLIWGSGVLAGVIIPMFLHRSIWNIFHPEVKLEMGIERRKRRAIDRRIHEAADFIVNVLGDKSGDFLDDHLHIRRSTFDDGSTSIAIDMAARGASVTVFESGWRPSTYGSRGGTFLLPAAGGGLYVQRESASEGSPEYVVVTTYKPGPWERHVKAIKTKAEAAAEKERRRVLSAQVEGHRKMLEAERKKFGL